MRWVDWNLSEEKKEYMKEYNKYITCRVVENLGRGICPKCGKMGGIAILEHHNLKTGTKSRCKRYLHSVSHYIPEDKK